MDDSQANYTPAHDKALQDACDILDKAFDGYIIVTKILSNDAKVDSHHFSFSSGRAEAIGLCEMAKSGLLQERNTHEL